MLVKCYSSDIFPKVAIYPVSAPAGAKNDFGLSPKTLQSYLVQPMSEI